MSFKDQLEEDMLTFFNANEFAGTHSINNKTVECVVMSAEKDNDVNIQSKQGISTSYLSVLVQKNILVDIPTTGDFIEFDLGLFSVVEITEVEGVVHIDLSKNIGKFEHSITIQELTTTKVNGIKKEIWTDVYEEMAYIRQINANEMLELGTILSNKTLLIKMPYRDGITSKMRLAYKGKFYNIKSVDNLEEKNIFLDLICESCD